MEPNDDGTYHALARHFSVQQMIDICLVVGLANMANRFNAIFLADLDERPRGGQREGGSRAGGVPDPLSANACLGVRP
jgi:hypothetical protein